MCPYVYVLIVILCVTRTLHRHVCVSLQMLLNGDMIIIPSHYLIPTHSCTYPLASQFSDDIMPRGVATFYTSMAGIEGVKVGPVMYFPVESMTLSSNSLACHILTSASSPSLGTWDVLKPCSIQSVYICVCFFSSQSRDKLQVKLTHTGEVLDVDDSDIEKVYYTVCASRGPILSRQ